MFFDPKMVPATFEKPHQYAKGVEYVLVNGQSVIDKETLTDKLPGKPVKRASE